MTFKATQFAVISLTLVASFAAYAGDTGPGSKDGDQTKYTISFDDFKYRCSDAPNKPLNEQGKPAHIKIVCTNVDTQFVPDAQGSIPMSASRHVVTTIQSDKFDVDAMGKDYPVDAKAAGAGACMRYKEVSRTIQLTNTLGCADVLGVKGDIQDYCAANLESFKASNPKFVDQHDTGNVIDTCGGTAGAVTKK